MTTASNGIWDIDDAGYYADCDHVSASMLEVFQESVPTFAGRFIDRTIPAPEPTAAMRLGTLLHLRVLQPDLFVAKVVLMQSKAGKAEIARIEAAGGLAINSEDRAAIESMAESLQRHTIAGPLLAEQGRTELPIRWDDRATGLPCKAKIDRLVGRIMLDLKSAAEPWPAQWARQAHNFKYHLRAAHYLDGAMALGMADRFIFPVVGKEPPYEVAVYELGQEEIELGRDLRREALAEMATRAAADDWSSRMASKIQTVRYQGYAFRRS